MQGSTIRRQRAKATRSTADSGAFGRPVVCNGSAVQQPAAPPRLAPFPGSEWVVPRASLSPKRDAFSISDSNHVIVLHECLLRRTLDQDFDRPHPESRYGNVIDQVARTRSGRNLFTAKIDNTMKLTITTSWVTRNGGSDFVGAIAFRAGTFWKACAIKTNTFRYRTIAAVTT